MNDGKKKVKFIRKNGRIIPIGGQRQSPKPQRKFPKYHANAGQKLSNDVIGLGFGSLFSGAVIGVSGSSLALASKKGNIISKKGNVISANFSRKKTKKLKKLGKLAGVKLNSLGSSMVMVGFGALAAGLTASVVSKVANYKENGRFRKKLAEYRGVR